MNKIKNVFKYKKALFILCAVFIIVVAFIFGVNPNNKSNKTFIDKNRVKYSYTLNQNLYNEFTLRFKGNNITVKNNSIKLLFADFNRDVYKFDFKINEVKKQLFLKKSKLCYVDIRENLTYKKLYKNTWFNFSQYNGESYFVFYKKIGNCIFQISTNYSDNQLSYISYNTIFKKMLSFTKTINTDDKKTMFLQDKICSMLFDDYSINDYRLIAKINNNNAIVVIDGIEFIIEPHNIEYYSFSKNAYCSYVDSGYLVDKKESYLYDKFTKVFVVYTKNAYFKISTKHNVSIAQFKKYIKKFKI